MRKSKVGRGLTKRIVITNSGLLKRKRANRNHLLTKKSTKVKGRLRRSVKISGHDQKNVRLMTHT
ncbi:50S ribosomal protein L35P [Candidatus Tremblaya phenacola PAVE]|nr:50S ribosomal protein L35P [Candidatus Tremblaya phenacola PAVE]